MEISSFEHDLIGLEKFAKKLEAFIKVERRFVPDSLVLSLNAPFGTGKTTFFKMWADRLENEDDSKSFVVDVNAWNDDYCGDPLVSLIFEIIESLERNNQDATSIKEAAKDIGWFVTGIGSQLVNKFTGIDPVAAGELAEKKGAQRKSTSGSMFEIFQQKKQSLQSLKESIRTFVQENETNFLVFVDELDRCRPDYAISYLETIKHVFDIQGITFILAVDRKQLECSAKAAFGVDLNFPEYYRKFIHREISLPQPTRDSYKRFSAEYVHYYLSREDERKCFMKLEDSRINNIVELISALELTPRQVQEVFRILGHSFETDSEKEGSLLWCIGVGTILMAALKLGNPSIYESLGKRKLKIVEAVEFIKSLHLAFDEWWFTLIYTGGGLIKEETEGKDITAIYLEGGFVDEGQEVEIASHISQWNSGWGRSFNSRFKQIYKQIEEVTSWN